MNEFTRAMTEANKWQDECERSEALFAHLEESTQEEHIKFQDAQDK